ncbi:hypothetical protein C8Q70DRAFT_908914 [Cubamyces menziesii]|nr:hypothetical protein C8Q70DRAFT_908914 [Cubamyces menziesii]
MATGFNVSSVIARRYPEHSPWDIEFAVYRLWPAGNFLPCNPFPDAFKQGALGQAQATGVNPFHFVCMNNPFAFDRSGASGGDLEDGIEPLQSPPGLDDILPLQRHEDLDVAMLNVCDEVYMGDECVIVRVSVGDEVKLLKLFLGTDADKHFNAESAACARFLHHGVSSPGNVLKCHGWLEINLRQVFNDADAPRVSTECRKALNAHGKDSAKGLVLDDFPGAELLSIHNISPDIAESVLRSLYAVHASLVLQGSHIRQSVLVSPAEQRAIWVDFSRASCDSGSGAMTRQTLLAEFAEAWHLVYQRLIPDSLIGWEAGPDAIDPRSLTAHSNALRGPRPRPVSLTVEDEIEAVLNSYPEIDIFSWDPPVSNLTPALRLDHRLDTEEFLRVIMEEREKFYGFWNPMRSWYGMCPLSPSPGTPYFLVDPGQFRHYLAPPPLPQLPSDTAIDLLEHICPTANRPVFKIRIGQQTWLMKIFSKDRRPDDTDHRTAKERFEIERDSYAHLSHYGACDAGVVPRFHGWMELSHTHLYDCNDMIRRTRNSGALPKDQEFAWVSPIFEDGSLACALIIEYIEGAEAISFENLTMAWMDLMMRAVARVHGSYVCHGDLENWNNMLIVPGREGRPDRAVVIDFDHAMTPNVPRGRCLGPRSMLSELEDLWVEFYSSVLPMQRILCKEPKHPHAVEV